MKRLIPISLCSIIFWLFCQASVIELNRTIIGNWEYQYSIIDGDSIKIDADKHCPVEKMVFKPCNDKKELNKMPSFVREQRQSNYFENISCKTYIQDTLIDTYFPVAKRIITKSDTLYSIFNYGCRFKSEFVIEKLNNNTLVIYDDKNYLIEGNNYTEIRHIYLKR